MFPQTRRHLRVYMKCFVHFNSELKYLLSIIPVTSLLSLLCWLIQVATVVYLMLFC